MFNWTVFWKIHNLKQFPMIFHSLKVTNNWQTIEKKMQKNNWKKTNMTSTQFYLIQWVKHRNVKPLKVRRCFLSSFVWELWHRSSHLKLNFAGGVVIVVVVVCEGICVIFYKILGEKLKARSNFLVINLTNTASARSS